MTMICSPKDLRDEDDVEKKFVADLLAQLGYKKNQIKGKKTLAELGVKKTPRGKPLQYRPDYLVQASRNAKFIVEAKSPSESLDDWIWQPKAYAVLLNSEYEKSNPVRYFVLTNGLETRVYKWDYSKPKFKRSLMELGAGTPAMDELRLILAPKSLNKEEGSTPASSEQIIFTKPGISDINEVFSKCHQIIYKSDNISQSAAFFEFVKIIALKLISDKAVRDCCGEITSLEKFSIDAASVQFSVAWINAQQKFSHTNPVSDTWFKGFIDGMEQDIGEGIKRRIFEKDGGIRLSSETIKDVVQLLQDKYLFGIDADLNGRLFETFLSATMRGKDLGQYFTPRSVVKLGVKLARINVDVEHPEKSDLVYDGCCGTGGFLIDVLAEMWSKIDEATGRSNEEKERAKDVVKTNHIWGCEIGKDPNLARIARLNMYLHGDGGATIFNLDGLDKKLSKAPDDTPDIAREKTDFLRNTGTPGGFFNVVITNPPFAKTYKLSDNKEEEEQRYADRVLVEYELLTWEKKRSEIRSNLMFMERYYDLLLPGGRLITVLDDGILNGNSYAWFRRWLLEKFVVKAVVSLPGDAFQRSKARVKTSFLILHKRLSKSEKQGDVFMYACTRVGLDDPSRARTLPEDAVNRELAKKELFEVSSKYAQFCTGKKPRGYVVPAGAITDRLDVKHCKHKPNSGQKRWKSAGLQTAPLTDLAELKEFSESNIIACKDHDDIETYLRVTYSGQAERGDDIEPAQTKHTNLYRVEKDDVVISNIAATYGSACVVDADTEGCVVSTEYTVLRPLKPLSSKVLWVLLRSETFRSEMLLAATGANRTRVSWERIKDIRLPKPDEKLVKSLEKALAAAERKKREAIKAAANAISLVSSDLLLEDKISALVLDAFKPPK